MAIETQVTRGARVNADVTALLRARNTLLWVVSREEERVEGALIEAAAAAKLAILFWDCADGITDAARAVVEDMPNPAAALDYIAKTRKPCLYVMRDLPKWGDPQTQRKLRSVARALKAAPTGEMRAICILSPSSEVPPELSGQCVVIDYPLPDRGEVAAILDATVEALPEQFRAGAAPNGTREAAIDAAMGLSKEEIESCFARSLVTSKPPRIDPKLVAGEKKKVISRQGLQVYEPDPRGMAAIGGYDLLKAWTALHALAFSKAAREYGLDSPKGCVLVGPPGCLTGDTEVLYLRGARNGGRPIQLQELYRKFNGIPTSTRPWVDLTVPTFLHSLSPDGEVFYNRVVSITEAGVKPVIRVDFSDGSHLKLTEDHPVATPSGAFVPAGELVVGQQVLARGSMKPADGKGRRLDLRPPRVIVNVKHHPYGAYKAVESNGVTYEYTRVARARLVVEAHMNDMPYDEFVNCLKHNAPLAATLKYLPQDWDVHHLDENTLNDEIGNLMALPGVEHARTHADTKKFNVEYTKVVTVTSVQDYGAVEMTYDVQMDAPANNFCANGVIVHNTGKSLAAKCFATAFGLPLFRADLGAAKSKFVGESEQNIRKLIAVAEAAAPCVLWVDEIDKVLKGASGDQGDGGVAADQLGVILNWMQETKAPVFVIATANDVRGLPPELLRRGRFDEVFFVDLPTAGERAEILKVTLKQKGRDVDSVDAAAVAADTDGFTGSEIAALVPDAMLAAFADGGRALKTEDILAAKRGVVPLSKLAGDRIAELRKWAEGRARRASSPEAAEATGGRKLALE